LLPNTREPAIQHGVKNLFIGKIDNLDDLTLSAVSRKKFVTIASKCELKASDRNKVIKSPCCAVHKGVTTGIRMVKVMMYVINEVGAPEDLFAAHAQVE
jgi:hypothetical protein